MTDEKRPDDQPEDEQGEELKRPEDEVKDLEPTEEEFGDLIALKGVVKYPIRIKCAVLAWDALQEGVTTVSG